MKNIKIYLLFFITGMLFSCSDATDINQPSEVAPAETFKTVEGLEKNLVSLYGSIGYDTEIAFASIFTDECAIGLANGGQGLGDGTWSYVLNSGSDAPAQIWTTYYSCINKANRIILGSENVEFVTISTDPDIIAEEKAEQDAAIANVLAQARTIRAFAYFQLMAYFSEDLTDDSKLGVMLFDNVPAYDSPAIPRSTNKEVFDFINADLDYAELNLFPETAVTYVNSNMIIALRARMAIYREDYINAQFYAEQLIEGPRKLASRGVYPTMYNATEAVGECLFKLERSYNDFTLGSIWNSVSVERDGSPFFEVGRSLYNKFPVSNSLDVRKGVLVNPSKSKVDSNYQNSSDYKTTDVLIVNKYAESEGVQLLADVKVFRIGEMYLIKAEAQVGQNDLIGAALTIKQLRTARISGTILTPVYADQKEAWADILLERRKELAFEGHRYLDMKRLGVKAGETFERDPLDCAINNSCFFSNTDHRLTMPIPKSELLANPFIRSQQNTGY